MVEGVMGKRRWTEWGEVETHETQWPFLGTAGPDTVLVEVTARGGGH